MNADDFYKIIYFTAEEVVGTGSRVELIEFSLMTSLDFFRTLIGRPVVLLPNGMTTGLHKSPEHKAGRAADISLRESDGAIDVQEVFKFAMASGFTGIGIYHNGTTYSFHLDIGSKYRFWTAHKKHRETSWTYDTLIKDPIERAI